jgi:hypothetical protein
VILQCEISARLLTMNARFAVFGAIMQSDLIDPLLPLN